MPHALDDELTELRGKLDFLLAQIVIMRSEDDSQSSNTPSVLQSLEEQCDMLLLEIESLLAKHRDTGFPA